MSQPLLERFLGKLEQFFKIRSSCENYGYLNARIRARISNFLTDGDYQRIAEGNLETFEQYLLESPYSESFRFQLVMSHKGILRRIEAAIAHHVSRQMRFLREKAEGEAQKLLEIALARSDLLNGRLILRASFSGNRGGGEPQWHNYGALPEEFYGELWGNQITSSDIIGKCRANGHPFALILARAISEMDHSRDIVKAERFLLQHMLDFGWQTIASFHSKNSRMLSEYLGRSIDMWNLGIWLRWQNEYIQKNEAVGMYIPNGKWLSRERLSKNSSLKELVYLTPWQKTLEMEGKQSPHNYQRSLFVEFMKWQANLFRGDPLGIEVSLGFMGKYFIEWHNLNLLAVGLSIDLQKENLLSKLIPVSF